MAVEASDPQPPRSEGRSVAGGKTPLLQPQVLGSEIGVEFVTLAETIRNLGIA